MSSFDKFPGLLIAALPSIFFATVKNLMMDILNFLYWRNKGIPHRCRMRPDSLTQSKMLAIF